MSERSEPLSPNLPTHSCHRAVQSCGKEVAAKHMDPDIRAPEVEIENVRAVGVADICELASHTVVREPGCTSHQLEFAGGGTAEVRYTDGGVLLNVTAEGCGMTWTQDGTLLLRSWSA